MPNRRILIIQGHPDPDPARYCRALADAYRAGAERAGHAVEAIDLAKADIPPLRSRTEWTAPPSAAVAAAQQKLAWADHLVIIYPRWLGAMPAVLKAFLEQVARPGFAFPADQKGIGAGLLKGKSSRIIVTMGMPALFYTLWFRALTLRALERNILAFVGIKPNRHTIIGSVEGMSPQKRADWLEEVRRLGEGGS